jgi:lipopolysaccharide biosynthesis regulator YciM
VDDKTLQQKYCSSSCKGKAKYDLENAAKGRKTRRTDQAKRSRAIELFARGLDRGSIARCLDVPVQTVKNWIYSRPVKRMGELSPELIPLLPLEQRLNQAKDAAGWKKILHDASKSFGTPGLVTMVTETIHGSGAPGRYASIVLEQLNQKPQKRRIFCLLQYFAQCHYCRRMERRKLESVAHDKIIRNFRLA